ncbi:MAG TPA: cupin fold metalloprotein, WbuC family [Rikenellaceae bacterium]|mgnify:FL=1|nr:cupin fold metalloprotein, WbuC family [Rikenellaceae bacterium]
MIIDSQLLDNLTIEARRSPRLRMNYDLRNSSSDKSQRMMNALEPGTEIPVHRHTQSSETVVVIRGSIRQNFYDDDGFLTESVIYRAGDPVSICVVPVNTWHNSESLEPGTIIFEAKDGAYEPLGASDILVVK